MESLIKYGKVTRGYLGVRIQDVTPALAKEFNLKDDTGALVGDVVPDSPAAKAGLKSGDVIEQFNGKPVTTAASSSWRWPSVAPGETVPVEVLRDGSTKTLKVVSSELPGAEQTGRSNSSSDADNTDTLQGVAVADLDPQARQQFDIPEQVKGAVVTQVEPDRPRLKRG